MNPIRLTTLSNGLIVAVEPMSGVRSVAMTWLIPAGAAHDPDDRVGLSALWAELLLRGSGDLDSRAVADAFDRIGASRSTRVGSRFLSIGATSLGAAITDVLPLIADMIARPRFDADAIEPVRELCVQSIQALDDEPAERCGIAARRRHHASPLNRSSLGELEHIRAATRDELVSLWSRRAVPGGSILSVAGAVDASEITELAERLTEGWSGDAAEPAEGAAPPRGYGHLDDDTNQAQIVLMADAPAEPDEHSMTERLAVSVLSGGMSSRLFTEVREKRGLCYSVHARYGAHRGHGVLSADVGTQPERAQESLDVLVQELERLATPAGAVTEEEFHRAVAGMKSRLVFSGESTAARASALASDVHRLGHARTLQQVAAQIDAISRERLNDYLARRTLGRVTVQTIGPAPLQMPASLA